MRFVSGPPSLVMVVISAIFAMLESGASRLLHRPFDTRRPVEGRVLGIIGNHAGATGAPGFVWTAGKPPD
jgi:hypothetical protein